MTPEGYDVLYRPGDNLVLLREPMSGRELSRWNPPGGVYGYDHTSGGQGRVYIGHEGRGDIEDPSQRRRPFKLDASDVIGARISPDGKLLAAVSEYGHISLFNMADIIAGKNVAPAVKLPGFLMCPHSVAFSPGGDRIVAGGDFTQALKLYDSNSHEEVLNLSSNGWDCHELRLSPDGNVIAADTDGPVHVWRAPSWAQIEAAEAADRAAAMVR